MAEQDKVIKKDVLWDFHQEYRNSARHNELLRANLTNMVIAISAGLVTLCTYDRELTDTDLPLALMVIAIGIVGGFFSISYTYRYIKHCLRARQFRIAIDELIFKNDQLNIENIRQKANEENRYKFKMFSSWGNSHMFWMIFPFFVALLGISMASIIIFY